MSSSESVARSHLATKSLTTNVNWPTNHWPSPRESCYRPGPEKITRVRDASSSKANHTVDGGDRRSQK